jgi:hypothetical protein
MWLQGKHPRNFWRIAYHAVFYAHLYLAPDLKSFVPRANHDESYTNLWGENPVLPPFDQQDVLAYIDFVIDNLPDFLAKIDISAPSTGFEWYPNMSKFDHQLMNLRHIQGHVGQLSELLMARDIDVNWVSQGELGQN